MYSKTSVYKTFVDFYAKKLTITLIDPCLTKCLLPGIDIINNAILGSGFTVYSMGVSAKHHQGGDKLGTLEKEAVFLPIALWTTCD